MKSNHEIIHLQKCKGIPMHPIENSYFKEHLKNVSDKQIKDSKKRVFKFLKEYGYIN